MVLISDDVWSMTIGSLVVAFNGDDDPSIDWLIKHNGLINAADDDDDSYEGHDAKRSSEMREGKSVGLVSFDT